MKKPNALGPFSVLQPHPTNQVPVGHYWYSKWLNTQDPKRKANLDRIYGFSKMSPAPVMPSPMPMPGASIDPGFFIPQPPGAGPAGPYAPSTFGTGVTPVPTSGANPALKIPRKKNNPR